MQVPVRVVAEEAGAASVEGRQTQGPPRRALHGGGAGVAGRAVQVAGAVAELGREVGGDGAFQWVWPNTSPVVTTAMTPDRCSASAAR